MSDNESDLQLYSTVFETWRFQVDSYWQRTSYFAVFETAALAGEWSLLNGSTADIYTVRGAAVLGIVLTVLWFLNNLKTHVYVDYWWRALEDIEKADRSVFKIGFVSRYEARRNTLGLCAPMKYSYQVQAIPFVFLCAWVWLFFLSFTPLQQSRNLNRAEKTTAQSQQAAQSAINIPPVGTIPDAAFVDKPAAGANQDNRTTDEKPKHDFFSLWTVLINTMATAVIAVFTFMMFRVNCRQNRETKIIERAWVVPEIGFLQPTKTGETFQVICKVHNKGRTPARITRMASAGQYVPKGDDLPETFRYPKEAEPFTERGYVMPPGAITETGIAIESGHLQLIKEQKGDFYFLGLIEYRDTFDQHHVTKYCYQLKPSQDLTNPIFEFYIGGPDRFNDAT